MRINCSQCPNGIYDVITRSGALPHLPNLRIAVFAEDQVDLLAYLNRSLLDQRNGGRSLPASPTDGRRIPHCTSRFQVRGRTTKTTTTANPRGRRKYKYRWRQSCWNNISIFRLACHRFSIWRATRVRTYVHLQTFPCLGNFVTGGVEVAAAARPLGVILGGVSAPATPPPAAALAGRGGRVLHGC